MNIALDRRVADLTVCTRVCNALLAEDIQTVGAFLALPWKGRHSIPQVGPKYLCELYEAILEPSARKDDVRELNISKRMLGTLLANDITSISQLLRMKRVQLMVKPGLGLGTYCAVMDALVDYRVAP